MEQKKSFVMYTDYWKHINLLTREQKGDLLSAIMLYAASAELPQMDGMTQMAFSFIKEQMDRDNEKYQTTLEKRKEAGKLGGRPSKSDTQKAKKANGFSEKQMVSTEKQTKAKKPDTDNVNDTDNVTDINNNSTLDDAKALFERLWKLFPNKKGKSHISDAQKKLLFVIGEDEMTKAIERYITELKKDEEWRKPQYGSTFFNNGYVDYLDENYEPTKVSKATAKKNAFCNFEQRTYDNDELERILLNTQPYGGKEHE